MSRKYAVAASENVAALTVNMNNSPIKEQDRKQLRSRKIDSCRNIFRLITTISLPLLSNALNLSVSIKGLSIVRA